MNSLLDWFANYCINNQLISKGNEAWFRYGLEKRISTLIVLVPFAIIAVRISGLWTALSFISSFFYLRSQTNGYHAKTHWGCFVVSILLELFLLMVIEPMLDAIGVLVLVGSTVIVVFSIAPYNHPMMDLNENEYAACKKAARTRCMLLSVSCYACILCDWYKIAYGISLGCAMTSALLVFAKITERRRRYDSFEAHGEQSSSFDIQ